MNTQSKPMLITLTSESKLITESQGKLTNRCTGTDSKRVQKKRRSSRKPDKVKPRFKTVWVTDGPSKTAFEDDYTKGDPVGEPGQFGKAFRVTHNSDKKAFVVKEISKSRLYRLRPQSETREHLLGSMRDEINILQSMNHKYIIKLYDVYESKHQLHLVMEECKGGELFDRIKSKGYFREEEAKPVVRKICEAIHFMHDKYRVVHCDLKPENILFMTKAEDSDIKIIDFGMSKVVHRLDHLRTLCGTPYYTAPEVIKSEYSHSADMWSIGVITYTMIFAMVPFMVNTSKYFGQQEIKAIYRLILGGFKPVVKPGFGPWFPQGRIDRISEDGMDFISKLLAWDTAKRLTAREALQHQWLRDIKSTDSSPLSAMSMAQNTDSNQSKDEVALDLDDLKEFDDETNDSRSPPPTRPKMKNVDSFVVEDMMKFAAANKFKYAVTRLFRDQFKQLKPRHFEELTDLFHEMDTDGNGKISYEEFKEGMMRCKSLQLDEAKIKGMFRGLDAENLGEFEFGNFIDAAVHDYIVASDARLFAAFRELDQNEDRMIKTKRLVATIQELNPYGNADELLKFVNDIDLDNDGWIDYEDFLRALHPDFNPPKWFWSDEKYSRSDTERNLNENKDQQTESEESEEKDPVVTLPQVQEVPDPRNISDDSQSKSDSYIVKEGWMMKQGGFVRNWKRRWFELQSNGLCKYYMNETADLPISSFNCKTYTRIKEKSWSTSEDRKYGIKVYTQHRDWRFVCSDESIRASWIKAFESVHKEAKCEEKKNEKQSLE